MAPIYSSYLLCVAFLGLLFHTLANGAEAGVESGAPEVKSVDREYIAGIRADEGFSSNVTEVNPPNKWIETKDCHGLFCIYANKAIANGRGLVVITTTQNLARVRSQEGRPNAVGYQLHTDPTAFQTTEVEGRGDVNIAKEVIRRGTKLISATPVLMVHKSFFDEKLVPAAEQDRLLKEAVKLMPRASREKFLNQKAVAKKNQTIKDIILARYFEVDLSVMMNRSGLPTDKHYVNYPEAAPFGHDCRPNAVFYIDQNFVQHINVARKLQPGDEITVAYVDPFRQRDERQERHKKWMGTGCTCSQCMGHGDLSAVAESDSNLIELHTIEQQIQDDANESVTAKTVDRLIQLYKLERLEARFAGMYELAAMAYSSLGYEKRAKKAADLAVQALIIEHGMDSNEVTAMRVMASDITGHYAWRSRVKNKKPGETKGPAASS